MRATWPRVVAVLPSVRIGIALRKHPKDSGDLHDADKLVPEAVPVAVTQVAVLEAGRIVELGTPAGLFARDGA